MLIFVLTQRVYLCTLTSSPILAGGKLLTNAVLRSSPHTFHELCHTPRLRRASNLKNASAATRMLDVPVKPSLPASYRHAVDSTFERRGIHADFSSFFLQRSISWASSPSSPTALSHLDDSYRRGAPVLCDMMVVHICLLVVTLQEEKVRKVTHRVSKINPSPPL